MEGNNMPYSGTNEERLAKQAAYNRKHYQNNKQYYLDKTQRHRERLWAWFKEYKTTLNCSTCPENHPACLDFHHLDKNEKVENVSKLVGKCMSKKAILKEISKCIVVCANCHRKLHYEENL
jgi:hypothetical protein